MNTSRQRVRTDFHRDDARSFENHTRLPSSGTWHLAWCWQTPCTLRSEGLWPLPTPSPLVTECQLQYSLNCTLGAKALPGWVRGHCEQSNGMKHTAHGRDGCHRAGLTDDSHQEAPEVQPQGSGLNQEARVLWDLPGFRPVPGSLPPPSSRPTSLDSSLPGPRGGAVPEDTGAGLWASWHLFSQR